MKNHCFVSIDIDGDEWKFEPHEIDVGEEAAIVIRHPVDVDDQLSRKFFTSQKPLFPATICIPDIGLHCAVCEASNQWFHFNQEDGLVEWVIGLHNGDFFDDVRRWISVQAAV